MSRYISRVGILQSAHKPATIAVVAGGAFRQPVRDNRLLSTSIVKVGSYTSDIIAMWDTGSTESILFLPGYKAKVGMDPDDAGCVKGLNGSMLEVGYYPAQLTTIGGITINTDWIDVLDAAPDFADMIIGMDIISRGEFCVKDGYFTFKL